MDIADSAIDAPERALVYAVEALTFAVLALVRATDE